MNPLTKIDVKGLAIFAGVIVALSVGGCVVARKQPVTPPAPNVAVSRSATASASAALLIPPSPLKTNLLLQWDYRPDERMMMVYESTNLVHWRVFAWTTTNFIKFPMTNPFAFYKLVPVRKNEFVRFEGLIIGRPQPPD